MTRDSALAKLDAMGFKDVYYILHLDNIGSIECHGILPLNEIGRRGISSKSFAMEGPQARRKLSVVPLHGGSSAPVHELVPLYFNPCNPTLIALRKHWHRLGIAVIPLEALLPTVEAWTVADGNAASPRTHYATDPQGIGCLDIQLLRASSWGAASQDWAERRRRRCAELLVKPSVAACNIKHLVVYGHYTAKSLSESLETLRVIADSELFHNGPFAAPPGNVAE